MIYIYMYYHDLLWLLPLFKRKSQYPNCGSELSVVPIQPRMISASVTANSTPSVQGKWLAAIGPGHPLMIGTCHPKQGDCITKCCGLTLPGVGVARDPTLLGRVTLVYRVGVA